MPVAGLMAAIHLLMSSYLSDVRTTGTGRVCQPRVRRRDEKKKSYFLTLTSEVRVLSLRPSLPNFDPSSSAPLVDFGDTGLSVNEHSHNCVSPLTSASP